MHDTTETEKMASICFCIKILKEKKLYNKMAEKIRTWKEMVAKEGMYTFDFLC